VDAGVRVAATIVCALACLALVAAERTRHRARFVAKPLASLAFIVVGAVGPGVPPLVLAGLILGAMGDVALLFERGFLPGLVAFLAGHIAYAVAFPPHDAWVIAPALGGLAALAWLWPHLGSMRVPVIAYIAAIVAMVGGALATDNRLLIAGAVAFFASDLSVARDKFVARQWANRAWGLPAYYAGQLLIAWAMS
jgi:uncharacterized membrane protein YhhN